MLHDALAAKHAILRVFPVRRVLVIGDVMLDKYVVGAASRISPEAPVPVVRPRGRTSTLGGAGNVAKNLAGLGLSVHLMGFVGEDEDAGSVRSSCDALDISHERLVALSDRGTIAKTRILVEDRQMLRLDEESEAPVSKSDQQRLLEEFRRVISTTRFDAVILSDYAKGVCSPAVCAGVIAECRQYGIPLFVDPKGKDYDKYRGATGITPNRTELHEIAAALGWSTDDPIETGRRLRERLGLEFVACTLGAGGIALVQADGVISAPTVAREVFDVSGAGDTVMATVVASLIGGLGVADAVQLANLAAAQVIAQVGSVAITKGQLLLAVQAQGHPSANRKIWAEEDLEALMAAWRESHLKVAFTNGCFDILHIGHVRLLEQAAQYADRLIVAVNSDDSVARLKGAGRPILGVADRTAILAALESVDAVVTFSDDDPLRLLQIIRPDVLVKGDDHAPGSVVGAEFVRSYGGVLRLVEIEPNVSSTELISRIGSKDKA